MPKKITDTNLKRLRKYMLDEANRLGQNGSCVVHKIDLDKIDESAEVKPKVVSSDPLERDLDVLFESSEKRKSPL